MPKKSEEKTLLSDLAQELNKQVKDQITDKDLIIVGEYVSNGFNQTGAFRKGNPESKANEDSIRQMASFYFTKVNVRELLRKYLNTIIAQQKDYLHKKILETYYMRAFYNKDDLINEDGSIKKGLTPVQMMAIDVKSIKTTKKAESGEIVYYPEYQLADRDKALDMLTKYMEMLPKESINLSITNETIDELKEMFDK